MLGTTVNQLRRGLKLSIMVALIAACGSPEPHNAEVDIVENLRQRNDMATRSLPLYQSIREALPDQRYMLDGREVRASEVFVVGTVVSVEVARSFLWELEDDVERRVEVKNDDPRRQVTTYHMIVNVDKGPPLNNSRGVGLGCGVVAGGAC